MQQAQKTRSLLAILSWIILAIVFIALICYTAVHVEDLLDSDMASEMILAKQLAKSGGILSNQWYYSTELRVVNTQLVYASFFHIFDDWQLVRLLGNVVLVIILLASYYFLCRRLRSEQYFPITAAILLLPLSSHYFYILLFGAYYIPRISMMFLILGLLIPFGQMPRKKPALVFTFAIVCMLSFALGLEGARMILILFVPVFFIVFIESINQFIPFKNQTVDGSKRLLSQFRQNGFLQYWVLAFFACLSAVIGFLINQLVLSKLYPFEHMDMVFSPSLASIRTTMFNQLSVIGNASSLKLISYAVWLFIGILFLLFLFRKSSKSIIRKRFIWFCMITLGCYSAFSVAFPVGLVAWHFVPVGVLFIPAVAVILCDNFAHRVLKQVFCVGLIVLTFTCGIQGYKEFANMPNRSDSRCNNEFAQIVSILKADQYSSGFATFWNGNVLTELSDGDLDVWIVSDFDDRTTQSPDLFLWLQDKSHEQTLPSDKSFIIWSREEYNAYHNQNFEYIGRELYRSEGYVVYEVKH